VCYSVLRCVTVCCSVLQSDTFVQKRPHHTQCSAVFCSVLQCAEACCSELRCITVCYSVLQCVAV